MRLNLILPKANVPDWLKKTLLTIQNWATDMDGSGLEDGTVTYAKLNLSSDDIPTSKIKWPEIHLPLSLPGADVTSTSTTETRCSGILTWDPSSYPTTGGSWYFEASIAISDAAQTVTCRLVGASAVGTVTRTGATSLAVVRSTALTMPAAASLYVDFKTSNVGATASFAGARLVFVPS